MTKAEFSPRPIWLQSLCHRQGHRCSPSHPFLHFVSTRSKSHSLTSWKANWWVGTTLLTRCWERAREEVPPFDALSKSLRVLLSHCFLSHVLLIVLTTIHVNIQPQKLWEKNATFENVLPHSYSLCYPLPYITPYPSTRIVQLIYGSWFTVLCEILFERRVLLVTKSLQVSALVWVRYSFF